METRLRTTWIGEPGARASGVIKRVSFVHHEGDDGLKVGGGVNVAGVSCVKQKRKMQEGYKQECYTVTPS